MQEGHRVPGKPMYPSRSRSEMWRHTHEEEGAPGKAHTMTYINVSCRIHPMTPEMTQYVEKRCLKVMIAIVCIFM